MDVIYAKFNSVRSPEYRVHTFFLQEGERVYVEKRAESSAARPHLEGMKRNKELLSGIWEDIKPLDFEEVPEGLRFPFLSGEPVFREQEITGDRLEDLTEALEAAMDTVLAVKDTARVPFEMTDSFEEFFGGAEPAPGEPAVAAANLDPVFSNFCRVDGKLYCYDYEWAADFPVPLGYLQFRILHYFYWERFEAFRHILSDTEFLERFGIDEKKKAVYEEMERAFQTRVLGPGFRWSYPERYRKEEVDIRDVIRERDSLRNRVEELTQEVSRKEGEKAGKDSHIAALEAELQRDRDMMTLYSKALRNPLLARRIREENKKYADELAARDEMVTAITSATERLKKEDEYDTWIRRIEEEQGKRAKEELACQPLISVLVPVYNVSEAALTACIESVLAQTYDRWELILVDDASTDPGVKPVMERLSHDRRIHTEYRRKNGGISKCTNTALSLASGEFVALLDCDDTLSPDALYEVARRLSEDPELDMIYSDEDKMTEDGSLRKDPHFKPEWSPDTLMSHMYTGHLGVYRKSLVDEVGGLRSEYDGSQDYDLVLRLTEKTDRISHISRILYHWREGQGSTAGNEEAKPYVYDAAKRAREDALKRRGIEGTVEEIPGIRQFRVNYPVPAETKVSIIIPTRDHPALLHRCIFSLKRHTKEPDYELIVIDNGSEGINRAEYENLSRKYDFRYIYAPMPFHFAAICNHGAAEAEGRLLLFLNDDTEILPGHGDWLKRMAGAAMQPGVGAVGAKLLYPDGTLQHTGILSIQKGPVHALLGARDDTTHYFSRNLLDVNTLAVTGACLMLRQEVFREMQGFSEDFAVAYNDVDLSMRLVEAGYRNVIRNDAVLLHRESVSRGSDGGDPEKLRRLLMEQDLLYERHPHFEGKDPYYNRFLAQMNEDYGINLEYGKETKRKEIDPERVMRYPEAGERVNAQLNRLESDSVLRISGWYFREDMAYTSGSAPRLLLESEAHSYIVSTRQEINSGLAFAFPGVPGVELSGFRAWIPRRKLAAGVYRIWIIAEGARVDTGKTIERLS